MTTMTIYVDSNLRWRRMWHSTPPAHRTRSVQWLTTAQAAAMYVLPSRTPSAFRTLGGSPRQGMEAQATLHSHPLVNCLAASHSRAHSRPEFRVLTRRLTRHSKIPSF
ncbi:hypothetical protein PoB_007130100 [Plakobranchus ocellatus]|uniref:Uncharacterized protein n=1 Tax=Plakobranchus ocellatus TaxID=259542 RepID=A0AAV4DKT9_9GAST|nr:hypothetical protein PoB_007130100 [Plakobranchus ocellatus]